VRERLDALLAEVRDRFAPDPRLAVFEVEAAEDGGTVVLRGATSEAAAADELHRLAALLDVASVRDEVERLPGGAHPHQVVVRSAIAPLLRGSDVSHPQVTQLVLGHRATVLRRSGPWLQVRGEDGYLGWAHAGYVTEMDESDARAWEVGAGGRIVIALRGALLDQAGEVLVQLPFGARVLVNGNGEARLPDGRHGQLRGEFVEEAERAERCPAVGEAVVRSALRWLGAPYLWGGVTEGGVDCSGLVQKVFALHGVALPRDADLQARRLGPLDADADLAALRPGDLLFFREVPERITHVAISMGGGEVVHASLSHGGVVRSHLLGARGPDLVLARLLDGVARPAGLA
jgi:gamma-D-glutamyl-L-lysine dipeptidyl-peptidase